MSAVNPVSAVNQDSPGRRDVTAGTPGPASDRSYIPALDGIRAVAIIVVMGYHGGVFFTSGGFFGVDLFFTLSGFLITSLLVTEWRQTSTIQLARFWTRRARRLLPALLLMLLGVALYSAFLAPPGTYPHLTSDGLAALFYFANWHFIAIGSNYFGRTGPISPLTHTWSLAVEEQFYFLWPLIVFGVLGLFRSKRVLFVVCVAGAVASAAEMAILYSPVNVTRVYYGTDTRAQSLLVGAALAVALELWRDRRQRAGSSPLVGVGPHGEAGGASAFPAPRTSGGVALLAVGLVGAVGCVVSWTVFSENDWFTYRGGFLLVALAASAVLLSVVCAQRSILALGLSWAPLRYVGRISYGLYLWHFPLFLYLDNARTGLTGYPLFAVRVALTMAIAAASYHLLERPIRQGTFLRGWRAWIAPPLAAGAVVIALLSDTPIPALAAGGTPMPMTVRQASELNQTSGTTIAPAPVKVLWLGDSTAFTLAIAMSAQQSSYGIASADGAILGCGVADGSDYQLQGVDEPMAAACSDGPSDDLWPRRWAMDIALYKPNVVVILAGRWEVVNRTYDGQWTNIENPVYAAYVKQQLQYAVRVAASGGAHVVLMTAPCYDTGEQPDGDPWPEDSQARLSVYNGLVQQVAATSPNTSLIDLNAMACPDGQYQAFIDGVQVRQSDGVHFAPGSGSIFSPMIWPTVAELGDQQFALTHDRRTSFRFPT